MYSHFLNLEHNSFMFYSILSQTHTDFIVFFLVFKVTETSIIQRNK